MENTDDTLLLINEDVLIQILVWLPVISLLRFKSVCKSWRVLIDSSFFIHLHHDTTTTLTTSSSSSSSNNKFGSFIFQTSELRDTTEIRTFMLKSSRRSGGGGEPGEVFEVEDLGVPPLLRKTDLASWRMVGSCNGLICSKLNRIISLWNPATRQFRLLPKSSFTLEEEKEKEEVGGSSTRIIDVLGFGFDVKTKDYKVVQIRPMFSLLHGSKLVEYRVQVYSLSTDSWRVFFFKDDDDSLFLPKPFQGSSFHMNTHGIYLNGRFFFHGTYAGIEEEEEDRKQRHWILSFDFTKEIFTPIKQFPDEQLVDSNSTPLILTYFGADKIAFLVQSYSTSREERRTHFVYDIWVLNEHDQEEEEEEESYYYWTKLQHSIRISTSNWIYPKVISGDGEFALIEYRCLSYWKLQLFNLVTKEEKTVDVYPTGTGFLRTGVYKSSLVSIIGGGGGGNGNGTAACSSNSS